MQGTIAQIIALTTYGNVFLSNPTAFDPPSLLASNSTFRFCESVRFVDLRRNGSAWEESEYAADPSSWLERLKKDRVRMIRLTYGPSEAAPLGDKVSDRMLVGFVGGGGRWLMEAIGPEGSAFWEAHWEVKERSRDDRKIWRVTYGRIAANQPTSQDRAWDLPELRGRLVGNLTAIGKFARSHNLEGFARSFESGLAVLTSEDPDRHVYHRDLAPPHGLPLAAAQLLGAAQAAWVFGGMGSWNDMGFDGEDHVRYERLSEELYQLLNAAILAGANAPAAIPPQHPWWRFWK